MCINFKETNLGPDAAMKHNDHRQKTARKGRSRSDSRIEPLPERAHTRFLKAIEQTLLA